MKVIYDRQTDTLSLILGEGPVSESDEVREGVIIDYDRDGKIVSVEVLDASERVAEPTSVAFEVKEAVSR
jgi:uncharacterized protein YuzE